MGSDKVYQDERLGMIGTHNREVMTKELAEKIFTLSIDYNRIQNEKFTIQKELSLFNWDQVQTEAMRYLMEAK